MVRIERIVKHVVFECDECHSTWSGRLEFGDKPDGWLDVMINGKEYQFCSRNCLANKAKGKK